jgi:hypothetical protein
VIAKILRLPVLTVEATVACDWDPDRPVYQVIARHTVERRVLGSNHRRSVFTHSLVVSYPLGFGDSQPDEAKWTSHGHLLHDPLDRLFQALRMTRYRRLHHSRLWESSDRTPYFPPS